MTAVLSAENNLEVVKIQRQHHEHQNKMANILGHVMRKEKQECIITGLIYRNKNKQPQ